MQALFEGLGFRVKGDQGDLSSSGGMEKKKEHVI